MKIEERLLSIRLLEKIKKDPKQAEKLGLKIKKDTRNLHSVL